MDWKELVEFSQMAGGQATGVDKEIVKRMLDDKEGLETKNWLTPDERNMLLLLAIADAELGSDNKAFRDNFLLHQLSLGGNNRGSLERMIPGNASPAAPAPTTQKP